MLPYQGHILTNFDDALSQIRETTIGMGSGTQRNLNNAIRGLIERDKSLCNAAIADDEDRLEVAIDHLGMRILTKYRPLATDLRMVITSMKVASHLERISDQALSIAKRSRKVIKNSEIKEALKVEGLYKVSSEMLANALTAYADTNPELALSIIESEKKLKKCHKATSRVFSKTLESETEQYRDYLDLVFICRWLERVGDLAINIAEEVVFEETSTDIRRGGELPAELTNKTTEES